MSTTSGPMKSLKVTDPSGNVYVMTPVDTEARQAIDEAKELQFDSDYFTADVSQDQSTVNVGLNGVPIGIETPLQFSQDDEHGIVIGLDTTALDIPTMTGATDQAAGTSGLVPAPAAGDEDKFLKGDGTWDTPIFDKNYSSIWGANPSEVYGMFRVSIGRDQYGYSGAPRELTQVGRNGVLGYLLPEPVEGTIPVSVKDGGNNKCYALKTLRQLGALTAKDTYVSGGKIYSLLISAPDRPASIFTYTDEGNRQLTYWGVPYNGTTTGQVLTYDSSNGPYWAMPANPLPTPSVDNSLLLGQSDGSKTWTVLERDTFSAITDDNGEDIQDEEGTSIGDENSVELWTSFNGIGFGAERAVADIDGNSLNLTISDDQVIAIGGKSIGGGTVVDAYTKAETDGLLADKADKSELPILRQAEASEDTTINVVNNRVTWVSNITYSTMTFNVVVPSGESANLAIELLSQHACTVSVTVNGVQVPKASAAINELEAGKTYQLTCVGYGWTCAEIDVPNYTVTVGNKTYGATRLGNHLWTTENLDYLFTGCTLNGTPENKPMAWNNSADPTYEDTYGIVYNYKAAVYLAEHADELLPSGWRLPTLDDWRQLGNTIGWDPTQSGQMVTGDKANAFRNTDWYMWNSATQQADLQGTNLYGLNVLPAGTCVNGEFDNIGSEKNDVGFWASDSLDLSSYRLWFASVGITYGWSYVSTSNTYNYGVHIRLVKDL